MYELKLDKNIDVTLDWDGDEASFKQEFERDLNNGFIAKFTLEIEAKEKVCKSTDYDVPDDVDIIISHIEIHDMEVFDGDEEVILSFEESRDLEEHLKESINY